MTFYLDPKRDVYTQAYSAAALAGSTKRKERRRKLSSTKGNAQGKSHLVSYMPLTMLEEAGISPNNAYPDKNPHVTVNAKTKWASWKEWTWAVV
jgi:hypothetical protein